MTGAPIPYRSKLTDKLVDAFKASPEFFALCIAICTITTMIVGIAFSVTFSNMYGPPPLPKKDVERVLVHEDDAQKYYDEGWSYEKKRYADYVLIRDKKPSIKEKK